MRGKFIATLSGGECLIHYIYPTRNVCLPFRTRIQGLLVDVGQLESFAAIFSGIGVAVHLASNTFLNYQDTLKQEVDDSKQMFLGIVVFRCR